MNSLSGASSVTQARRLAATGRLAAAAAAERRRAAAAANNNNNDSTHPPPAYDPEFPNDDLPRPPPRQRARPQARARRAANNRPDRRRPVDVEAQYYPETSQQDREEYLSAYLQPTTYEPVRYLYTSQHRHFTYSPISFYFYITSTRFPQRSRAKAVFSGRLGWL